MTAGLFGRTRLVVQSVRGVMYMERVGRERPLPGELLSLTRPYPYVFGDPTEPGPSDGEADRKSGSDRGIFKSASRVDTYILCLLRCIENLSSLSPFCSNLEKT